MTPEAENALIARAVATCRAVRDVTLDGDGYGTLICGLAPHDGPVHWDPADSTYWAAAQPGMTRDQAETVAARIREAMAA